MRVAVFLSHPIQYFTPLLQELSTRPGVEVKAFYFSRHGVDDSVDRGFGVRMKWDIDLRAGYESEFLPRQAPTRDVLDFSPTGLNRGLVAAVRSGWDAIFVAGYAHLNNWVILAAARRYGIPVLCFADSNLRDEAGKPLAKRVLKRIVLAPFLRGTTVFLGAGGQARAYLAHYGVAEEAVFLCPYAVDVDRFRGRVGAMSLEDRKRFGAELGIPPDKRVVLFCGKLVEWKRPGDLVEACARLAREDVVAVLVGDGDQRAAIERRSDGGVVVTGFVNQTDLPVVLSLADVFVLPSSREPYGIVASEAQCLGVPAIVSDVCGCHGPGSVVQDGVSGFVYPCGDVDALAEKIRLLLDDDDLHARMRSAAQIQGDTQSQVCAADGFVAAVEYAMHRTNR